MLNPVLVLCGKMCGADVPIVSLSPISNNIGPRKPELLYYSKLQNHSRIWSQLWHQNYLYNLSWTYARLTHLFPCPLQGYISKYKDAHIRIAMLHWTLNGPLYNIENFHKNSHISLPDQTCNRLNHVNILQNQSHIKRCPELPLLEHN